MSKAKERRFGTVPDWAKRGPIDARNYDYRAEAHCALKYEREGEHPTITRQSAEFSAWQTYFDKHLGGRPLCFRMLIDGSVEEMTVPDLRPEVFDVSYSPGQQRARH